MEVTALYDLQGKMGAAAEWARTREALGFDALRFPELAHDPFMCMAVAAEQTDSISIGTGVAIAFARSPYVTAKLAWDLQEYSKGRLLIGLGPQVRAHNERRYSVPWGPPIPRLREYIETMRAIWHSWRTGEPPSYEGEHYRFTLEGPFYSAGPINYPDPLIMLGASQPRMTRLAAGTADGVVWSRIVSWAFRDDVLLPAFEEEARASNREPGELIIAGGGFIITARDEERLERAIARTRRVMATYASAREHYKQMEHIGFGRESTMLYLLSAEQRWDDMEQLIGDDFIDHFAIIATWDELPARVAERYGGVNTEVEFPAEIETPEDAEHAREVIEALRAIPAYGETESSSARTRVEGT